MSGLVRTSDLARWNIAAKVVHEAGLRSNLIAQLHRLIPPKNILPGAKSVFSETGIKGLDSKKLTLLGRFFHLLSSRGLRNIQQFKLETFSDLTPTVLTPVSQGEWIRFTLNELGCALAYRLNDGQFIIGIKGEVVEGLLNGTLKHCSPHSVLAARAVQPTLPSAAAGLTPTEVKALVVGQPERSLATRMERIKLDLRIELRDLLRKGQAELAAALLFSAASKMTDIIEIIGWCAVDAAVFDCYENDRQALDLQRDADTFQRPIGNDIKLFGYLIGRYGQAAPILAAEIIGKITGGSLSLKRSAGIELAVDILAMVENRELRANVFKGLAALGKTKLADRLMASAMADEKLLYHERFEQAAAELSKRKDEVFLSMIAKTLGEGNADYAAQAAFAGYSDIVARIENLSRLGFIKFGKLLGSLSEATKRKVMIDLAFAPRDERSARAMEETALALLWLADAKDIESAAAFILPLLAEEGKDAVGRFAVRRLLFAGLSSFLTCGDYRLVYDKLEETLPEIFKNDAHIFVASDGKLSKDDPPLGDRANQLKHYFDILKDSDRPEADRTAAAQMMDRLDAHEYFDQLLKIADNDCNPAGRSYLFGMVQFGPLPNINKFEPALLLAIARIYSRHTYIDMSSTISEASHQTYLETVLLKTKKGSKYQWLINRLCEVPELDFSAAQLLIDVFDLQVKHPSSEKAIKALGDIGERSHDDSTEELKYKKRAVDALESVLDKEDAKLWPPAIEALAKIRHPDARLILEASLKKPQLKDVNNLKLIALAIFALGDLGDPASIPVLVEGLRCSWAKDEASVGPRAAASLILIGKKNNDNGRQVVLALDAVYRKEGQPLPGTEIILGEIGDPLGVPLLRDSAMRGQTDSYPALAKIGTPEAVTSLVRAIEVTNHGVTLIVPLVGLEIISKKNILLPAAKALAARPELAKQAFDALAKSFELRIGLNDYVPEEIENLKAIIDVLAVTNDPRAVNLLLPLSNFRDFGLRGYAVAALRRMADPDGIIASALKIYEPNFLAHLAELIYDH